MKVPLSVHQIRQVPGWAYAAVEPRDAWGLLDAFSRSLQVQEFRNYLANFPRLGGRSG